MTSTFAAKYRPLLLAALAVIVLPFALHLMGLSLNTGTMVVALAIAAMGLNLCIGYTGLVSFGHGAWFGIGAYLCPPQSTAAKIRAVRAERAAGWSLFSWSAITREGRDDSYLRALRETISPGQARVAPVPRWRAGSTRK